MELMRVVPVTSCNAGDLASLCVPEGAESDALWIRAIEAKRQWALDRLRALGTFAWLARDGEESTGMIQCHPERNGIDICFIDCMWVPRKHCWGRGIGGRLLAEVMAVMQCGHPWFDGKPADGIAARAFHGEAEGQQSAESFYMSRGFEHAGGDAELVFHPLRPGVTWNPSETSATALTAIPDDDRRVTVLLGPLDCPFVYRVLARTGAYAGEKLGLPVVDVDATLDPEGYRSRGGRPGILVCGRMLHGDLWERDKLDRELACLHEE